VGCCSARGAFYRLGGSGGEGRRPAAVELYSSLVSKELKEEEETGRRCLDGGNEEGGAPVWFGYSRAEESSKWRRTATRRRPGATAARARLRKNETRVARCWAERPSGAGRFRWE
jgi:hypothetical protein